jgi:hypothetical protein
VQRSIAASDHCRSRLDTKMSPAFLKGHFCRPASHESENDIETRKMLISSKVETGLSLACRVPADHPSQRQEGATSTKVIPPTGAAAPLDLALALSVPAHSSGVPLGARVGQDMIPPGQTFSYNTWTAFSTRRLWG